MATPDLWDLADDVLGVAAARLTSAGRTPPDRQFVSPGAVAFDCEQLAIEVTRAFHGLPALELGRVGCAAPLSVDLRLTLTRECISLMDTQGNPPSDIALNDNAHELYLDGWALYNGILEAWYDKDFSEACNSMALGPLLPVGPEGNHAGWTLALTIQLRDS